MFLSLSLSPNDMRFLRAPEEHGLMKRQPIWAKDPGSVEAPVVPVGGADPFGETGPAGVESELVVDSVGVGGHLFRGGVEGRDPEGEVG
jgi:hypothetical protein